MIKIVVHRTEYICKKLKLGAWAFNWRQAGKKTITADIGRYAKSCNKVASVGKPHDLFN